MSSRSGVRAWYSGLRDRLGVQRLATARMSGVDPRELPGHAVIGRTRLGAQPEAEGVARTAMLAPYADDEALSGHATCRLGERKVAAQSSTLTRRTPSNSSRATCRAISYS
jgi:hypothetical protein